MVSRERIRNCINSERHISILVQSLFSSWLLAFLFEGQILYSLAGSFGLNLRNIIVGAMVAHFVGLFSSGFLIRTKKTARRFILVFYVFCILSTSVFLFPTSILWPIAAVTCGLLSGGCVAGWSYFYRDGTPRNERTKTAADVLIYSNVLMILLNMAAIHVSPYLGLVLSMLMLAIAFISALRLPTVSAAVVSLQPIHVEKHVSIIKPLAFLCLFIVVLTINSGLMYQVINPAYAHLGLLTSWYWAVPYIVAVLIMKNLSRKTNRTYILFVAIAMMGFAFIGFITLGRSILSYLVIDTLMLGACGVFDLFWWSILGEMLEYDKNPVRVFGVGLSSNVLGIMLGGFIGKAITSSGTQSFNSTLLAMAVVCVTLVLLPPLHKQLSAVLKDHAFLTTLLEMPTEENNHIVNSFARFGDLSDRERQVAALLLQGKTYRTIAGELFISENTVKYYVKNIYSKFNIQSRTELINMVSNEETTKKR